MAALRNQLLSTSILVSVMAAAAPALAQEGRPTDLPGVTVQGQTAEPVELDEVVTTGSRIRRDPTNAPTPLIQVSREELLSTGQSTVIDYLATIPALSNSYVPSDTTGTGLDDGGLSLANLRSLGTGRTLTLVDGRRHVGSSGGSLAVDVDTIPRLLIETAEIITGGASSVYGADAVSGVLNFKLRRDFEGLEIDANYGMINQDGQANRRISALLGANLLDDRLNLWGFGEYEMLDEVRAQDIDWVRKSYGFVGVDVDPNASPSDGIVDARVFSDLRTMQRMRWGVVSLANNQPGSPTNDPDVSYFGGCTGAITNATLINCTLLNPGHTWVLEGSTARLADFGTRVGTGFQRTLNIGGDGELASEYSQYTMVPRNEAHRLGAGMNFALTPDISARLSATYSNEDHFDQGQPTFFDIYISDRYAANRPSPLIGASAWNVRLSDNAFIPTNLLTAIQTNTINIYGPPTATDPSPLIGTAPAPWARSALRGPDRDHYTNRELMRVVGSLEGTLDSLYFLRNVNWDIGYTYGQVENAHRDTGVDVERMAFGADAVFDTFGAVNGTPGEVVCRVQLLAAQGVPIGQMPDQVRGGDIRQSVAGQAAIDECQPLNIWGPGNQSQAALDYIYAETFITERNEQEQAIGSISGELWDFWGAGRIGAAVGVEYRREYTEAIGRDRSTGDRFLFLNTGADFPGVQYESEEAFAEIAIPLMRDGWLGEFAELSGSYRHFDYTTVGTGEVYGINLVYRPIRDIAFKTSFNTSFRAPDLGENFSPYSQTFANFTSNITGDPCMTTSINASSNAAFRTNRIANCSALLAAYNTANGTSLAFDFAGATPGTSDDFMPAYGTAGTAGVSGGNPFLKPEESESFTFSMVIQPRMFPNLSLVLDYYEIEITDIIATVNALTAAANCVNGPSLNTNACDTIFRRHPSVPFGIGAPSGDPIGGFIQGSINYAKRTTRGLDFTGRYSLDLEEVTGHNLGRLDYALRGLWLIEQKQFNNASNPNDYTGLDGDLFYPRVRLSSSLTYSPNDRWSVNWTMDWQAAQEITNPLSYAATGNVDARLLQDTNTGNFARHDFTVRWRARDDLNVRMGVVNAFDAEQSRVLGSSVFSNFDPYGTRFFVGLTYSPF